MEKQYNSMEMMICAASRVLEDNSSVMVGTGAPCAASMLAQKLHAKSLLIYFEAGGVGPQMPTMPISVGDSRTFHRAVMAGSMYDIMENASRGLIDYAFVSGAQIDMYGNLNATIIGDYKRPKVRFPGSGGANDITSLCWRSMVVTPHSIKRFVKKVDFITSPGYLQGGNSRDESGLPLGTGPYRVITDLGVMGYDDESKRMKVIAVHPGFSFENMQENTEFELLKADEIGVTEPPTEIELEILRNEVDPNRYIIGR
ncbi:MAG: 3-oxoacid CoA-transferase [Planctomycetes bacterium]|nr:3-oxoacid CoA-transferase [Planctomycetota bacterium]